MINECPSINQLKRWEVSRDGKWELMVRRVDVNCRALRGPEGPRAEQTELDGKAGFRGRPAWVSRGRTHLPPRTALQWREERREPVSRAPRAAREGARPGSSPEGGQKRRRP